MKSVFEVAITNVLYSSKHNDAQINGGHNKVGAFEHWLGLMEDCRRPWGTPKIRRSMSQTFTDNLSSEKLFVSAAIRQSPKILTLSKGQVRHVSNNNCYFSRQLQVLSCQAIVVTGLAIGVWESNKSRMAKIY